MSKIITIEDPSGRHFVYKKSKQKGFKYEMAYPYKVTLGFKPLFTVRSLFYSLSADGVLVVRPAFAWDGASGPTIDTKNTMRASCVHDILYDMISNGDLPIRFRKEADLELQQLMIEDGINQSTWWNKIRAGYFYAAVRIFGFSALGKKTKYCIER